jgi:acyl-CoA reductase-like NAD-dependent aldehyde dehydrogenase
MNMPEHCLAMAVPGSGKGYPTMEVLAPFDRKIIGAVELGDTDAVERALENATSLFRDRDRWLSRARRIEVLQRTAGLLAERAETFAIGIAKEGGKPLLDARVEVARAVDGLRNSAELVRGEAGAVVPMDINTASANRLAFTQREPIGVVTAVSAFNHPLNLIAHQVAPAIAAGCPVIVKPAEATPLSCFRLVALLREAGLPDAWCQALVTQDHEATARLVSDARVGFFSFVGSARVGWQLRSKLAPGTRCALEHGGVAPVIVAPDADLGLAVPRLLKGGFYHAGQVCVSVQRVFAHRRIFEELVQAMAASAERLRVGDPTDECTEVGPLIRPQEVMRVHDWVNEAVQGGGRVACGGTFVGRTCYRPTIVLEPPHGSKLSTEEVFGPVICVYPYDHLDDAIDRANHPSFAFHAAVFTRDLDTALRAYARLDASAVIVNDHTAFRVDWMPFAGLKQSGLGVGGIPHTFREMQIEKMFVGVMS